MFEMTLRAAFLCCKMNRRQSMNNYEIAVIRGDLHNSNCLEKHKTEFCTAKE